MVYNSAVLRHILIAFLLTLSMAALAQQPRYTSEDAGSAQAPPASQSQPPSKPQTGGQAQPPVKVNVLNVCSPSQEDQQTIASTLSKIPRQPLFTPDFELSRGRSSLEEQPGFLQAGEGAKLSSDNAATEYVRIRRELAVQAMFSTVQYSFSTDPKAMIETLVFRVKDPKDVLQVSIEDSASAVTSPTVMLGAATPASRIKLERFGKSSIVLARCTASDAGPAPDQSVYEPLFRTASSIVADYRDMLHASRIVPDELTRIATVSSTSKTPGKKAVPAKK